VNHKHSLIWYITSVCTLSQWPLQNDSHPYIRLDFILLSESILRPVNVSTATHATATTARVSLRAGVDSSNVTEVLSDHFPVYASWGSGNGVSVPLF
jgi:endonuclease/exonuclease/phosphatase family metal-dependent hydrolase